MPPPTHPRTPPRAALLLATLLAVAGCSREKPATPEAKKPAGRPPVPVVVAKAATADVPVEIRALGTVEPVQSSPVRSQVAGIVTEVGFREGDRVQAGQLLFRIDPRPIEASIRQLQANLVRDKAQIFSAESQTLNTEAQVRNAEAQLKNAEAQAKRYADLVAKDLVSREQYDQRATALDAARAALDAARAVAAASRSALEASRATLEATTAAIDNAKLQLEYTAIKAPVDGQAGAILFDRGDLVKVNDSVLVVVNQIHPIHVRFTVPEPRLPEVLRHRGAGSLAVRVTPPGAGAQPREGRIVFVDNAVDRATGTIALKAELDNRDASLWPGQFVEVALVLEVRKDAVVVPAGAVQQGQQGAYVFVVENGAAAVRPVTAGTAVAGRTLIEQGLAAGETVVTDGQLRLTPGAPVAPRDGLAAPAATGPGAGPKGAGAAGGTGPGAGAPEGRRQEPPR